MRGEDKNKVEQQRIIEDILDRAGEAVTDREKLRMALEASRIDDITEYGRMVHAEMEALLSLARNNISSRGATLYCTTFPCHNCAKHIVAAGIKRVVYIEPYDAPRLWISTQAKRWRRSGCELEAGGFKIANPNASLLVCRTRVSCQRERSTPMMENQEANGSGNDERQFVAHLEQASQIVRSWPAWKQTVLGGGESTRCAANQQGVVENVQVTEAPDSK